jgi:hypothetical protein
MQFEYKIHTQVIRGIPGDAGKKEIMDTESMLNKLGKEGWELVSSHYMGYGSYSMEYVFKRSK